MAVAGNAVVSAHTAPRGAVRNKLVVSCVCLPARVHICLTASEELNILEEEGSQSCECQRYGKGAISLLSF